MKKVAVLGGGKVGSLIAEELGTRYKVTVVDRNPLIKDYIKLSPNMDIQILDINAADFSADMLPVADLYIGAVPGWMGYKTVAMLASTGKPVVDISFFGEDPAALHEMYKTNNAVCILDAGIAPGFSNIIAGYYAKKFTVTEFVCYVGGLPVERNYPHEYVAPFSPIDVIEEYTRPARIVEDGKIVIKRPLSEPEYIEFENIGELEAFNSDGLRSLLHTLQISNMKEKTLRYPKHAEYMRFLQAAGFFEDKEIIVNGSPVNIRQFTSEILLDGWKGDSFYDEFTVMRIEIKTDNDGVNELITYDVYDRREKSTGYSSMARTTGYTCCAIADLVFLDKIPGTGLVYPENIHGELDENFSFVLEFLRGKGIKIEKKFFRGKN